MYIETTKSWCDKYGNPTTQDISTLEDGWVYNIESETGNQFNGFTDEIEIKDDNLIFLTVNLGLKITKIENIDINN